MKRKKIINLLIASILLIMFVGFYNAEEVRANQNGDRLLVGDAIPNIYIQSDYNGSRFVIRGRILRRSSDMHFVYCLQPATPVDSSVVYNIATENAWEIQNLTREQWERITLIAYYGYGYGNHTDEKWWAITQVMIWWITNPEWDIYFTEGILGRRITPFNNEIAQINQLVDNHARLPSFHGTTHNLVLGSRRIFNDTNNVLNQFDIDHAEIEASINGNDLIINANSIGRSVLTLKRSTTRFNNPPFVYFHSASQNFMSVGSFTPLVSNLELNIIGGKIIVDKVDYNTGTKETSGLGTLEGAIYDIFDSNDILISQIRTDAEGRAILTELPIGRYYIIESTPSEGYLLDPIRYIIEITEDDLEHTVISRQQIIQGQIKVDKIDYDNKTKDTWGKGTLAGAVYEIFNHDGLLMDTIITNEEGYAISRLLPFGRYYIREKIASQGYMLDLTNHEVWLKTDGNIYTITSYQQVIRRNVEILKSYSQLETGILTPEQNVTFHIYDHNNLLRETVITDEFGFTQINGLAYGNYRISQITGSSGTEKIQDINFTVNDSSPRIIRFNIVNNVQIIEVPDTLLNEISNYLIIGSILIFIGFLSIIYKKLKKQKVSLSLIIILSGLFIIGYNYYEVRTINAETERRIQAFFVEKRVDSIADEESYVAILEIPAINLKRGLVNPKSSLNNVEDNITIIEGSYFPNIPNTNLILAAHSGRSRASFFRHLNQLTLGNRVILHYRNSQYIYEIIKIYTQPRVGHIGVSREEEANIVTLTTCEGRNDQLIIVGKLILNI